MVEGKKERPLSVKGELYEKTPDVPSGYVWPARACCPSQRPGISVQPTRWPNCVRRVNNGYATYAVSTRITPVTLRTSPRVRLDLP